MLKNLKTRSKRYKVSLSIESIIALREAMQQHLNEIPSDKWTKDYKRTVSNMDRVINKHEEEIGIDGYERTLQAEL